MYVITGGLGSIGLTVAAHLGRTVRARVALVTRKDTTDQDRRVAERLDTIRRAGGDVRVVTADVTDAAALERAFLEVERAWGPVDGVFHAAGVRATALDEFTVANASPAEPQLAGRVDALSALARSLAPRSVPFCLVFSSTAALLGGPGFTAYAAASAFADSFVVRQRSSATRWISVNWDGWPGRSDAPHASPAGRALTIPETAALDALNRIVAHHGVSRVVAAARPLENRREVRPETMQTGTAPVDRPAQSGDWLPQVLHIWRNVLGDETVDPDANFFDLGGDSLLLIRVRAQIAQLTGCHVPIARLFEHPTASRLAAFLALELGGAAVTAPLSATADAHARGLRQRDALARTPRRDPSRTP